jgi:excisionase family DNA binding protein
MLLTRAETAKKLNVSIWAVNRLVHDGKLKTQKVGRRTFVLIEDEGQEGEE